MHELVREWSTRSHPFPFLMRLPLDGGALVAAFAPEGQGSRMQWLAKSARGEAACRRLRAERDALLRLAPLAERLCIPRLLDYRESDGGGAPEACLLQTALSGLPMRCRWRGHGSWRVWRGLAAADAWLIEFQQQCRLQPDMQTTSCLADLAEQTRQRLQAAATPAADLLSPLLEQCHPPPASRCIPIHGDFWAGNLIWRRGGGQRSTATARLGVVDWSGLGFGSALDDLLTWMASLPCAATADARLALWRHLWFAPGRGRDRLRARARAAGYTPPEARAAFYLFLARRLGWEMGLDLQARNQAERKRSLAEWSVALDWLRRQGFPDPFC
ncbi:MAG TPA: phosphotransferase [Terriglobales bacterium]|nr:phosphotransferase [Terriglobales bacterium]